MHRYDIIAQICHARRLAEKLQPCAKMIELHGGHLVSHERTEEVPYDIFNIKFFLILLCEAEFL